MKPKTKRKLKWRATTLESGKYSVYKSVIFNTWIALNEGEQFSSGNKTKRQATQACEAHAREKGRK